MAAKPKLVRLMVEETSGVDHPAHLVEGWLVAKSAGAASGPESAEPAETVGKEEHSMAGTNDAAGTTVENADERIAELEAALATKDARIAELEKAAVPATTEEPDPDDVLKDVPEAVRSLIEKERQDREAAITELNKEREQRALEAAVTKARAFEPLGLQAEDLGPQLLKAAQVDEALAQGLETMLKGLVEQVNTSELFKSFGTDGDEAGNASAEFDRLAKAAIEAGEATTMPQAISKVAREHPDLYERYRAEKGA